MKLPEASSANRRLVRRLVLVIVGMFFFGFALVPLYYVFCKVTGLNGKTGRLDAQAVPATKIDTGRWVTVEFTASVNQGMPWEFRPTVKKMRVHPGEIAATAYYARNLADETIAGQAVPSVTPGLAGEHFKKLECFCFSRQELKAKEGREMPVRYVVQADLPQDITTVTLSYTFFNVDKQSAQKYGHSADKHEYDYVAHVH